MYSSGYSQVSKYSPQARKKMVHRSKGKSCGYYMRIVFLFSSLIQSLIIVSLVLFLIYGKDQDSASTTRIRDLEESFSRLSIENVALRHQRKNLTTFLNTTLTEKARVEWDLARLKHYTNTSLILIQEMQRNLLQCHGELLTCKSQQRMSAYCPSQSHENNCNCGILMEQLKAKLELEKSNFTQTVQVMRINLEQTARERDTITLEVIRLRRDKSTHEKEVALFKQKCKDDFTNSLKGISGVTSAFLEKIDSFFPSHHTFQLTCPKQGEYLEQIRTNCSSLSRDLEDRFQRYLNNVGDKVSTIQSESSRLTAENQRLNEDYRWCSQNRTNLIQQNKKEQEKLQLKHDQEKEKHLIDKMKLQGQVEVLENNVKYRMKEVEHLFEQMKLLNMSCLSRGGFGGLPGGFPRQGYNPSVSNPFGGAGSTSLGSPFNRAGQGSSTSFGSSSTGSSFNRPAASNPSLFSTGQSSSSSFGSNKPSTGSGSSSSSGSSLFGSSSSSGTGYNKPSTGSGSSSSSGSSLFGSSSSSGTGYNKPSTGSSSSSSSSSSGSSLFGSSSSSGTGYNKPSTGSGSSSSSGSSLFGSSNSGVGSSKPSTGSGSSSSSGSSLFGSSSSGVGSSKPSSGSGSSSSSGSSLFGSSSSSGLGSNKPSSGSGTSSSSGSSLFGSSSSSGSGTTKTESAGGLFSSYGGRGSSSSSSSSGSAGSSSSSSGLGSNKPSTIGKSSSTAGSSSSWSTGSSGSTSKSSTSSSGGGWFNMGGGSSGPSKTGTATGKSTSSGSGSTLASGRSTGFTGGPLNVAQHIKDLQRLINPNVPEEKQDLSRMLG